LKHSRSARLKYKYGLTVQAYDRLLAWQGGVCLICGRPSSGRRLSVDHCHVSRLLRALLCDGCNTAAGNLRDDPVAARRLADFLDLWHQHLHMLGLKKENNMTANEDTTTEGNTAILIRRALEHELHQPFGVEPPPPGTWLQALARALVIKAGQSDVQALKEVFDRASGDMPAGSAGSGYPGLVNVPWKVPSLLPTTPIPVSQEKPRRKWSRSVAERSTTHAQARTVGRARASLNDGQRGRVPVRRGVRSAATSAAMRPDQARSAVPRPAKSANRRRLS
jgi:hypothetical protein